MRILCENRNENAVKTTMKNGMNNFVKTVIKNTSVLPLFFTSFHLLLHNGFTTVLTKFFDPKKLIFTKKIVGAKVVISNEL